jgi:WD40 repeat protein
VRVFTGQSEPVYSVVFSPDGKYVLTGSTDNTAKLWNTATGQVLHTFSGHSNSVRNAVFSPDGSTY